MSCPSSSKCVAKLCRSVWQLALGDPCGERCSLQPLLQQIFVAVMPHPLVPIGRIARPQVVGQSARRKQILPAELAIGLRVFFTQGMGQPDPPAACSQIARVQLAHPLDLVAQPRRDTRGERHGPINVPFGLADDDLPPREIDVLDPQPANFEDPHARAVEQFGHDEVDSI